MKLVPKSQILLAVRDWPSDLDGRVVSRLEYKRSDTRFDSWPGRSSDCSAGGYRCPEVAFNLVFLSIFFSMSADIARNL